MMRSRSTLILAAILCAGAVLRLYGINERFGVYDWGTAEKAVAAKNFLTYGYAATGFLPVLGQLKGNFQRNLDTPPLLVLSTSVIFALLGPSEIGARLLPVTASLITLWLLYEFVRRVWDERMALLAAFFAAIMPMAAFFGRQADAEVPVLFFHVASLLAYVRWLETRRARDWALLLATIFFGCWVNYTAAFIVPTIILHNLLFSPLRFRYRQLALLVGVPIFVFVVFWTWSQAVQGTGLNADSNPITPMAANLNILLTRTQYSLLFTRRFYLILFDDMLQWCTPVAVVLLLAWLWERLKAMPIELPNRKATQRALGWPVLLLLLGFTYAIAFPQSASIHAHTMIYLVPGLSLISALSLDLLPKPFLAAGLVLFCVFSIWTWSQAHLKTQNETLYYDVGMAIEKQTKPDAVILSSFPQATFYMDRSNIEHYFGISRKQIAADVESLFSQRAYSQIVIAAPFVGDLPPIGTGDYWSTIDTVADRYGYQRSQFSMSQIVVWSKR